MVVVVGWLWWSGGRGVYLASERMVIGVQLLLLGRVGVNYFYYGYDQLYFLVTTAIKKPFLDFCQNLTLNFFLSNFFLIFNLFCSIFVNFGSS